MEVKFHGVVSALVFGLAAVNANSQTMTETNAHICVEAREVVLPAPGECGFNDLGVNRGVFLVSSTDWKDGRGCVEVRVFVRCHGP